MKRISDRLLRERNCLMIYNKIERVFVTTHLIFNYYNNDFSLEITSKVQKVSQKYTFTHKLTTDTAFRRHLHFLAQPSRNGIVGLGLDEVDQMKGSHGTGSEANFGFGHALMPS